jgi:phosphatidylinositol alpha-1,6-mannosyltransferase
MRALLISDIFPPQTGGSGRWFWEVYRRLPRGACLIAAGESPGAEAFDRTHDLPVVRMPLTQLHWGVRGAPGYGRALRRLGRAMRGRRIDQVHAARALPEGVLAWCLKTWYGLPYLCYAHGEEITCTSESRELRWLARRVVAGADRLIANSRNTARLLEAAWGARPGRVRILHPGVDTDQFRPAPPDPAARARLGWGARPVVLTVGRLQKRKGHDMLIRALGAVRRAVPDVLYVIAGTGEEEAALRDLTAREGVTDHVQFLGQPDDETLVTCYQQCDLFVLPNRQDGRDIEGFGMVLLEAQACGKPVIAGSSGGTAETMSIPATGCVVDCSTPAALGPLTAEWLADRPRLQRVGAAARAWAVERFDWSAAARQAWSLFRTLGAGRRAPAGGRRAVPFVK